MAHRPPPDFPPLMIPPVEHRTVCWPWSHQWLRWTDTWLSLMGIEQTDQTRGFNGQTRVCQRCGKRQVREIRG